MGWSSHPLGRPTNPRSRIRERCTGSLGSIAPYLFSKEFTLLVLLAFLISAPLGYYTMHEWLQGFFYRVALGWGIFALAISGSLLLAWLTVGYKAVRAALANQ